MLFRFLSPMPLPMSFSLRFPPFRADLAAGLTSWLEHGLHSEFITAVKRKQAIMATSHYGGIQDLVEALPDLPGVSGPRIIAPIAAGAVRPVTVLARAVTR
jgi:hypothetical protein